MDGSHLSYSSGVVEIESRKERILNVIPLSVVLFFFCFCNTFKSLIMKVHSSLSDNLSGKMIEGFYILCWSWFSLVLRDRLTNTRIPLQRDRLAVYDRRPGESRVHWISFGITVLVEIGSRKDSSVVASNDNKTGVKRRHY